MVDPLIPLQPFDKFFSDIGIIPDKKDFIELILLVVEFIIEVFVSQVMDDGILGF